MIGLLKRWFPLYKHCLAVACSVAFLLLTHWSKHHHVGYFQEWLSRWDFVRSWAFAVILIYLGAWIVGVLFAVGHVAGVPIAQQWGDALLLQDPGKYEHAYIWMGTIALCLSVGIVVQIIVYAVRRYKKAASGAKTELPRAF